MEGAKMLNRDKIMKGFIPDIFDHKTALYVGASGRRQAFAHELKEHGYSIDCLEIWPKNFVYLNKYFSKLFDGIVLGDVKNCDTLIHGTYDIAVWWQGPEHIAKEDLAETLDKLLNLVSKFVVISCPWGIWPQGAFGGNPYEEHKASLYPEDFKKLGWEVRPVGEEDGRHSCIIAWKRRSK